MVLHSGNWVQLNTRSLQHWKLYGIYPHATHTRLLEDLCPVPHLEHVLFSRYIGFIDNLRNSSKDLLQLIYHSCSSNLGSVTGQNIRFLTDKFNLPDIDQLILLKSKLKTMKVYTLSDQEMWKINLIEEVALLRKNHLDLDFDQDQLDSILDYICVD